MTLSEYRNLLLDYLNQQKEYEEEDIKNNEALSDDEKIENGLLIPDSVVSEQLDNTICLSTPINNTKLRPGDSVMVQSRENAKWIQATVIENSMDKLMIETKTDVSEVKGLKVKVSQSVMLDSIIELIESITDGAPGAFFLEELAKISEPKLLPFGAIDINRVKEKPTRLNEAQMEFYFHALKRPTLSCLQGPPGTGKTDVLANIAKTFSEQGLEVLILSLTHQAVNNALNKVASFCPNTQVVKVGPALKATELKDSITTTGMLSTYLKSKGKKKKKPVCGDVVGMTIHSSVINLGLRSSGFTPSVILVDEASQLPLTIAATIGAIGCGSILFIGDDKQMPPIFHEKLQDNPISVSIFNHLCDTYPTIKHRLSVTYRMNDVITEICSRNYYEPFGEKLVSSDFSKDRRLELPSTNDDEVIRNLFSDPNPIFIHNPSTDDTWKDENPEEAVFIAKVIKEALSLGMKIEDIAVITPYRLQVRAIRTCVLDALGEGADLPLIDTVERLQGQDVDFIIMSMSVSDKAFFASNKEFLLNPNRLNVMLSRAKKKVAVICSNIVETSMDLIK